MAILGVILGAIVTLFAAGINADADQNRRYQAQQDAKVALDKMRREGHSACTVSAPATYNTWMSSVTFYYPSDTCGSGTHSITWCTKATGSTWALYRAGATSGPPPPPPPRATPLRPPPAHPPPP